MPVSVWGWGQRGCRFFLPGWCLRLWLWVSCGSCERRRASLHACLAMCSPKDSSLPRTFQSSPHPAASGVQSTRWVAGVSLCSWPSTILWGLPAVWPRTQLPAPPQGPVPIFSPSGWASGGARPSRVVRLMWTVSSWPQLALLCSPPARQRTPGSRLCGGSSGGLLPSSPCSWRVSGGGLCNDSERQRARPRGVRALWGCELLAASSAPLTFCSQIRGGLACSNTTPLPLTSGSPLTREEREPPGGLGVPLARRARP